MIAAQALAFFPSPASGRGEQNHRAGMTKAGFRHLEGAMA